MKTTLLAIDGKKIKDIDLPKCFNEKVRNDVIAKIVEIEKEEQPYGTNPKAGKHHSASGILSHMRHKWKTTYGHGIARTPRKILWRRGDQFYWVGAEVANTRGGRRAHPHKTGLAGRKINKKEYALALRSALSATANIEIIRKKYSTLSQIKSASLPVVVEDKMLKLKAKEFFSAMQKILGEMYDVAIQKRELRTGKGRHRNRRYKKNAGVLFIIGKDENFKISGIEVKKVPELKVIDLASGSAGRLAMFSEKALKELEVLN